MHIIFINSDDEAVRTKNRYLGNQDSFSLPHIIYHENSNYPSRFVDTNWRGVMELQINLPIFKCNPELDESNGPYFQACTIDEFEAWLTANNGKLVTVHYALDDSDETITTTYEDVFVTLADCVELKEHFNVSLTLSKRI